MDKLVKRPISILNLAGEISPELAAYFVKKQIKLVDPVTNSQNSWSHILTKGIQDFTEIKNRYGTTQKNIKIVSLSTISDLQHFVSCNGKLMLDDQWLKTTLGPFILDKFFQEYGGISLEDNYPTFKEVGSFNITNPFNTGEYLDRMVQGAYQDGVSGLSIKTFFDHLVMYLTGLKTQGKVGMPIEVSYGHFEEVFGVQLHFYTKDLILEDISSSLSSEITKRAEKYLLNIAVQSSEFFDFSILKEVNKTVITGLWTKDDSIKVENRGMLFSDLSSAASITNFPSEGVTSFQAKQEAELQDYSDKIVLPETLPEVAAIQKLMSSPVETQTSQVLKENPDKIEEIQIIPPSKPEVESVQTISGAGVDDEAVTLVKDSSVAEEEVIEVISGSEIEDEIINIVKGNIEEEEEVFKISGSKNFDVDKFAFKVSSGIEEKAKGDMRLKSLSSELPEAIKSSFKEFANKLNKPLELMTQSDLDLFKEQEVPKIIKSTTQKVDSNFKTMLSGQNNKSEVQVPDKALEMKAAQLSNENEMMRAKIKTLMTEVKILKQSKTKMAELQQKTKEAAEASLLEAQSSSNNPDAHLRSQLVQKMEQQKILNEQDMKRLTALMEREAKSMKEAKEHEIQLKKLQIEIVQKDSFYSQEMEKLNRLVKGKDLILIKTKDSMTKIVEQKENELRNLGDKLNQTSKALANNQSQNHINQIRELERKVTNHEKMIEIYKNKIAEKPAVKVEDEVAREENRKLQSINTQFKNQLDIAKKDLLKYQEKITQDAAGYAEIKMEKLRLEQAYKKLQFEAKKTETIQAPNPAQELEIKRLLSSNDMMSAQLKETQIRMRDLETKLQEAVKAQKKEAIQEEASNGKGKTGQLENNVRKLTTDLVDCKNQLAEMKKETNKLRQEKTSLMNQLDKFKKDADKAKAAMPKKPGSNGKAA